MLGSLRLVAAAALFVLPYASATDVSAGPNALDQCTGCVPIYKAMVKCQQIKRPGGVGDEITNCICIDNRQPDEWYGWLDKCRYCLPSTGEDDDFFGTLASMITQLFVSCTNAGGNVVSDGESICASNAMWRLCASLKDGSDGGALSWATVEDSDGTRNSTQLLHLAQKADGGSSSSGSTRSDTSTTGTTATATESQTQEPSTTAGTEATSSSTADSKSTTTSQSKTATTSPSSATQTPGSSAASLSYGSQTSYVLGLFAAAGVVVSGLLV